MPTVGDEPVEIGYAGYLIQNLGPGNVFIGGSNVTEEDGLLIKPNQALAVGYTNTSVYAVSDDTADVRVLVRGAGIFSSMPEPDSDTEPE